MRPQCKRGIHDSDRFPELLGSVTTQEISIRQNPCQLLLGFLQLKLAIFLVAYGDTKLSQIRQELVNHHVKTAVEDGWSKHTYLLESSTCVH